MKKPPKPILPYKIGTCTSCLEPNKKLITKHCFEEPKFCYQNMQKEKYKARKELKSTKVLTNPKPKKVLPSPDRHKTVPELLKLATIVFNKYIRTRDTLGGTHFICISCNSKYTIEVLQAGHYMPSTYSKLRFEEMNCHGECIQCNCHDNNHLVGYRENLINKIGVYNVKWLESHKIAESYKWDREELMEIITKYKALLK